MACGGDVEVEDIENGDEGDENDDEEEEDENDDDNNKKSTKTNLEIDESLFNVDELGDIQDELENLDLN